MAHLRYTLPNGQVANLYTSVPEPFAAFDDDYTTDVDTTEELVNLGHDAACRDTQ